MAGSGCQSEVRQVWVVEGCEEGPGPLRGSAQGSEEGVRWSPQDLQLSLELFTFVRGLIEAPLLRPQPKLSLCPMDVTLWPARQNQVGVERTL